MWIKKIPRRAWENWTVFRVPIPFGFHIFSYYWQQSFLRLLLNCIIAYFSFMQTFFTLFLQNHIVFLIRWVIFIGICYRVNGFFDNILDYLDGVCHTIGSRIISSGHVIVSIRRLIVEIFTSYSLSCSSFLMVR